MSEKPSSETIAHYNAVLIEDLRSEFKFVVEHVSSLSDRLDKKFDEQEVKFNERFNIIEAILQDHSCRWQENDKRWEENHAYLREMLKLLNRTIDDQDALSQRVDAHDRDLSTLKTAVFGT